MNKLLLVTALIFVNASFASEASKQAWNIKCVIRALKKQHEIAFDRSRDASSTRIACWVKEYFRSAPTVVTIYDAGAGSEIANFKEPMIQRVAFHPQNSNKIAVRFADKKVKLYDMETQTWGAEFELYCLQSEDGPLAFSKDGNKIAVGSQYQQSIDLIDLNDPSKSQCKKTATDFKGLVLYEDQTVCGIGSRGNGAGEFYMEWQPLPWTPERYSLYQLVGQEFNHAAFAQSLEGRSYLLQMKNRELKIINGTSSEKVGIDGAYEKEAPVDLSAQGDMVAYNRKNGDNYEVVVVARQDTKE